MEIWFREAIRGMPGYRSSRYSKWHVHEDRVHIGEIISGYIKSACRFKYRGPKKIFELGIPLHVYAGRYKFELHLGRPPEEGCCKNCLKVINV